MRLYHAAMTYQVFKKYHELFPNTKLNILQSFADLRKINKFLKRTQDINSIILDSGTYSLESLKGNEIDLSSYVKYLKYDGKLFDFYFNYDEFDIFGTEDNYDSMVYMQNAGLNPVPVVRDIYVEINKIIDKGYKYIALASPHINTIEDLSIAMEKVEHTDIKVHLLGELDFEFLSSFPINSVDASSWTQTGAYGDILFFNREKEDLTDRIYLEERMISPDYDNRTTYSNYEYREKLDNYLESSFGIDYYDLICQDHRSFYKQLVNLDFFVMYEAEINNIHRQKNFATDE